ncbi:MAG: tetratricopeptide repeat protein [Myxococcota bacterium]
MSGRIDRLRTYLEGKPEDRFAMYSLALEYKKAGEHELAKAAFEALLKVHPDSGAGHYQHGLLFAEAGDEEAARAAWKAGLEQLRGLRTPDARRSTSEIQGALDELD